MSKLLNNKELGVKKSFKTWNNITVDNNSYCGLMFESIILLIIFNKQSIFVDNVQHIINF